MALPTNRIRKIKLPDDNIYDIVPSTLTDGTTSYALTVPTLTSDSTIAVDANIVHKTGNETIGGNKTFTNKVDIYNGFEFRNADYTYAPTMITSSNNGLKMQFNTGSQYLQLSATPAGYINIQPNAGSVGVISNQYIKDNATLVTNTLNLPDSSGTLATTDDIPDVDDFVTGPASSTNNAIAVFDGTTGKVIKQPTSASASQPLRAGDLCLETSGDHLGIYTDVISMPHSIILGKQGIFPTSLYSDILEIGNNSGVQVDNKAQFTVTQKANDGTVKSQLVFPLKGTSSNPATIATTDLIVSAEFVEEVPTITFTVANTPRGTITFEVPENSTWEDLVNNGVKDSTNTYTISIYNGNVTLNSNAQYLISTASNRNNPVSTASIPTDGTTYYYVNPASLN